MGRLWLETHEYAFLPPKSAKIRLSSSNSSSLVVPSSSWRLRDAARASRLPLRSTGGCSAAHLETWSAVKVCSSRPTCVPGLSLAARGLARGACQQRPSRGGLLAALAALLRRGAGGRAHGVGGRRRFTARCPLRSCDTSPTSYGPWLVGARVGRAARAAAQNLLRPPTVSLRSKRKYSTNYGFISRLCIHKSG